MDIPAWKAAAKLNLDTVPVHVAADLSEEQIRQYRIAVNKSDDLATWNMELLAEELKVLSLTDTDLQLIGFSPEELGKVMNGGVADGKRDPDDIPAPPGAAISRRGDVWILGEHRLMCGGRSSSADGDTLRGKWVRFAFFFECAT